MADHNKPVAFSYKVLRNRRSRKKWSADENGTAAIQRRRRARSRLDAWMKERSGELGAIARQWFEVMRKCADEARELLHDGCPVACLGDARFGYVSVFLSGVSATVARLGSRAMNLAHLGKSSGNAASEVNMQRWL